MTPNEASVWLTQYRGLAGWVRGPKGGGLEEVALAPVEAVSRLPNAAWHGGGVGGPRDVCAGDMI